jgi:hypothetical protein
MHCRRLFAATTIAACAFIGAAGATESDTRLAVSARVLRHVRMQVVAQPQVLVVTEADVRRGWVEAPAPMQVSVQSNSQDGYSLSLTNVGPFVRSAQVGGLGGVHRLHTEPLALHRPMPGPGVKRDVVDLSFRFELAPETRHGTYAWPIQVAVLAL